MVDALSIPLWELWWRGVKEKSLAEKSKTWERGRAIRERNFQNFNSVSALACQLWPGTRLFCHPDRQDEISTSESDLLVLKTWF